MRTEGNEHGHAGLTLAAHLAEFELARKIERGPVGDGELANDGENDCRDGSQQHVSGGQAHSIGQHSDRQCDFYRQHGDEHQILSEEDLAEVQRRREVDLNAAPFVGETVIGGRHQNEDEVGHDAGKKHFRGDPSTANAWVSSRELRTEQKDEQRRH